jgi:hypothetical protein
MSAVSGVDRPGAATGSRSFRTRRHGGPGGRSRADARRARGARGRPRRAVSQPAARDPHARVAGTLVPRDRGAARPDRRRGRDASLPRTPLAGPQARPLARPDLGTLGSLGAWAKSLFAGTAAKVAATAAVVAGIAVATPAVRHELGSGKSHASKPAAAVLQRSVVRAPDPRPPAITRARPAKKTRTTGQKGHVRGTVPRTGPKRTPPPGSQPAGEAPPAPPGPVPPAVRVPPVHLPDPPQLPVQLPQLPPVNVPGAPPLPPLPLP